MTMRISLTALQKMKQEGERIAMLTAYDASFAAVVDAAGVEGRTNVVMRGQFVHDANHVGMLEEDQATVSVVVREGAEGFGAYRDLRVQFERRIEVDGRHGISRRRTCHRC